MPFTDPNQSLPDLSGQRQFQHGTTCVRERWEQPNPFDSQLNECRSWIVKLSQLDSLLHLISRPEQFDIILTAENAKCLSIYNEAPELRPEQHGKKWHEILAAGWEVWGVIDSKQLVLVARHPIKVEELEVKYDRSLNNQVDNELGQYMWLQLYEKVFKSKQECE